MSNAGLARPPIAKNINKLQWYAVALTDDSFNDFAIVARSKQAARRIAQNAFPGLKISNDSIEPVLIRPRAPKK